MVARSVSPQVAAQATTALFLLLSHALACGQLAGAPSLPLVLPLRPAAHTRHSRGGDSAGISASGRRALRSALNKSLPCPIAPPLWGQRVGTPQLARHKWTPQQGKLLILMCDHGQVSIPTRCSLSLDAGAGVLTHPLLTVLTTCRGTQQGLSKWPSPWGEPAMAGSPLVLLLKFVHPQVCAWCAARARHVEACARAATWAVFPLQHGLPGLQLKLTALVCPERACSGACLGQQSGGLHAQPRDRRLTPQPHPRHPLRASTSRESEGHVRRIRPLGPTHYQAMRRRESRGDEHRVLVTRGKEAQA